MRCSYIKLMCPICKTVYEVKKSDKNNIINCLCGKKLMIIAINGTYEFVEV